MVLVSLPAVTYPGVADEPCDRLCAEFSDSDGARALNLESFLSGELNSELDDLSSYSSTALCLRSSEFRCTIQGLCFLKPKGSRTWLSDGGELGGGHSRLRTSGLVSRETIYPVFQVSVFVTSRIPVICRCYLSCTDGPEATLLSILNAGLTSISAT